jgi:hypothetical protein
MIEKLIEMSNEVGAAVSKVIASKEDGTPVAALIYLSGEDVKDYLDAIEEVEGAETEGD